MIPAAVVFDCDGVLVDSEPHSRRSWAKVLDDLEHPGTEEDVAACTGLGFGATRAALERLGPLPPPEVLWPLLMIALEESYRDGLDRFDDAVGALDVALASGIPCAVASASPRQRLDLTLETAGLADRFDVSVAGDEVAHGKPAPDGYLLALTRLGHDVGPAVAVEDSVMGVRSAQAAGLRVVAVVREHAQRQGLEETGVTVVEAVTAAGLGIPG